MLCLPRQRLQALKMLLSKVNKAFNIMPLEVKTSEGFIFFLKPSDFLSSRGYQLEGNK